MTVRILILTTAVLLLAVLPRPASAGEQEALACRAALKPVGQQMYDAVAPHVRADSKLRDLMRKHVKELVLGGRIARADAQANAPAVGACLRLLQT
ncbi:MAG: hypothetical protein ACOYJ6_14525 [Caulobacterales bacterium]